MALQKLGHRARIGRELCLRLGLARFRQLLP